MEEIVERAINGEEKAFTELMLRYQQDLYKIALTRLHSEYEIEEAVQETMISAYKNLKSLKDKEKLKKWLIKILINKCNAIYRKKMFKLVPLDDIDNYRIIDNNHFELESESKLDFYSVINLLDKKERTIMVLYYSERYTTKEIAEILNKNENTVKTIIHRAKIKLQKKYKEIIDIDS